MTPWNAECANVPKHDCTLTHIALTSGKQKRRDEERNKERKEGREGAVVSVGIVVHSQKCNLPKVMQEAHCHPDGHTHAL